MTKIRIRNEKDIQKAAEALQKIQSRCHTRTFSQKDIISLLSQAEQKRQEILSLSVEKKYFKNLTITECYNVANGYKYSADTTKIIASITKYGKKEIAITRTTAQHTPRGGYCTQKLQVQYV